MSREAKIVHERGDYWVCAEGGRYTVYKAGPTHSVADSSYPATTDGLSYAIARCDYKGRQQSTGR